MVLYILKHVQIHLELEKYKLNNTEMPLLTNQFSEN